MRLSLSTRFVWPFAAVLGVCALVLGAFGSTPDAAAGTAVAQPTPPADGSPPPAIVLSDDPAWKSNESDSATALAWGDVDQDGDLDLAVTTDAGPDRLYLNQDGQLEPAPSQLGEPGASSDLVWADFNADGWLDLATAGSGRNTIYLNSGQGALVPTAAWESDDDSESASLAAGDLDGDGRLDLVAGNRNGPDYVYFGQVDGLPDTAGTPLPDTEDSTEDLLIVDYRGERLILTTGWSQGASTTIRSFAVDDRQNITMRMNCDTGSSWRIWAMAWGDLTGDGQAELAFTSRTFPAYQLFIASGSDALEECAVDPGGDSAIVNSTGSSHFALVDANSDGVLDVAFSNGLYTRQADGSYATTRTPFAVTRPTPVTAVSWADVDGDGDLDVAVALRGFPVQLYHNQQAAFTAVEDTWATAGYDDFAWGDIDNDGDYDRVVSRLSNTVYLQVNNGATLQDAAWRFDLESGSADVVRHTFAWGDANGDGFIDLAVGTLNQPNTLWINNQRSGFENVWQSDDRLWSRALAWGDVDRDGDLDLAVGNVNAPNTGNGRDQLFENVIGEDGSATLTLRWQSADATGTDDIRWLDVDGDGDSDLVARNENSSTQRVYLNEGGELRADAFVTSEPLMPDATAVDVFGDGLPIIATTRAAGRYALQPAHPSFSDQPALSIHLVAPGRLAPAEATPQSTIFEDGTATFNYVLRGPDARLYDVHGFYSLDGGLTWSTAVATATTQTDQLTPGQHAYTWDIIGSGVVGTSDSVRFRLQVRPNHAPVPGDIAGLYQRPFAQTESLPFRIRGRQIQVLQESVEDDPLAGGAVVFRLPADQTDQGVPAQIQRDAFEIPFSTGDDGFLSGRGVLGAGDQLVALWPVPTDTLKLTPPHPLSPDASQVAPGGEEFTTSYTLFNTSAAPDETGLNLQEVTADAITQLTVSDNNKLLVFHLNVSLEWDARNDALFLQELEESFKQASAILYDTTDGQVALGEINLFHDKAFWSSADIVIHADNGLRPYAAIGGIVNRPIRDPDVDASVEDANYYPGQIHMGTVWDPYGERTAELGADWTRAMAHELAHYLLFLPDNYLGIEQGILRRIDCPGSFMTTTTDPGYSEFLIAWPDGSDCQITLAQKTTARTDWETIRAFYPFLTQPVAPFNDGPTMLPIAITRVLPWVVDTEQNAAATLPFASRNFDLRAGSERVRLPAAQAFLLQQNDPEHLHDDVLIALGAPSSGGDRLKVRGAENGDRLCVVDTLENYAGCEEITAVSASIPLAKRDDWNPTIAVASRTAHTAEVTVTFPAAAPPPDAVLVQLFPMHYGSVACNAPVAALDDAGTAVLTTRLPAYEVGIRVWQEDQPLHESFAFFLLNPDWESLALTDAELARLQTQPGCETVDPTADKSNAEALTEFTFAPIAGPNTRPVGGPNTRPVGGPNTRPVGGPSSVPIGGPNTRPVGGPNTRPVGGPNTRPVGGTSQSFQAPILSADAQVTIYDATNFFADNGIESLQKLPRIPNLTDQPWLVPVGSAYHVTNQPGAVNKRFIAFNYLQRDVPPGYEHTLALYFLPDCPAGSADCEQAWERLTDSRTYVENLVVAPLAARDGTYAVMSTVQTAVLHNGWNLLAYPMPDERCIGKCTQAAPVEAGCRDDALAFLGDRLVSIQLPEFFAHASPDAGPPQSAAPAESDTAVDTLKPGHVYWVNLTGAGETGIVAAYAPPRARPDGTIPCIGVVSGAP